jgi:hypothetical protein
MLSHCIPVFPSSLHRPEAIRASALLPVELPLCTDPDSHPLSRQAADAAGHRSVQVHEFASRSRVQLHFTVTASTLLLLTTLKRHKTRDARSKPLRATRHAVCNMSVSACFCVHLAA